MKNHIDLMLDSGAFSAWNRDEDLPIEEYIEYVQEYEDYLGSYVNMDVIPQRGMKRSIEALKKSGEGSYANLQTMKREGLSPIPVFHQGEDFHWLRQLVKDGEKYIGLSVNKLARRPNQQAWLDTCYSLLTDEKGRPLVDTHGFGITYYRFMFRYPWRSLDSTTWQLGPGYGHILVPVYHNGKPDYTKSPVTVVMSGRQRQSPTTQERQFEALGDAHRNSVLQFIEEEVGVSLAEIRYRPKSRYKALLVYYKGVTSVLKGVRFKHRAASFLENGDLHGSGKGREHRGTKLMYACPPQRTHLAALQEMDCTTLLLSYYELRKRPKGDLEELVATGNLPPGPERRRNRASWDQESYMNARRLAYWNRFEEEDEEV